MPERHQSKPYYFTDIVENVNHLENVRYCSICDKWMCDSCRANYPEGIEAAANEFRNGALRYAKSMLSSSK